MNKDLPADMEELIPGRDFDAIVIGASAGAIETLRNLVAHLRCRSVTHVVVVHLPAIASPDFPQQFADEACLPVKLAEHRELALPGMIYFAPTGAHLIVEHDGVFALSHEPLVNYSRPSIDVLFESAADTWGRRTVGIILSGSNDDGARGLKAIAEAEGLTLVQDPDGAVVPYMPTIAIRTAHPAAILSLDAMTRLFDYWTWAEGRLPPSG